MAFPGTLLRCRALQESDPVSKHIEEEKSLTPPLKWAGGKRWLVPRLSQIFSQCRHSRLVEPFSGGLAVALGISPARALLSDVNPHLINFYCWLQKGLVPAVEMENTAACYYRNRKRFNELVSSGRCESCESAALFYYLNRTGFNGLCRFNSSGFFNVPFGRYARINYCRDFREYCCLLSRWKFRCGDFQKIKLRSGDFVYADPPYDVEFTRYSRDDFGWEDQVRLAEWLACHKGPVVASNQATPRIIKLYKKHGFRLEILSAPRMISCNGDRTPAREMLAARGL